LIRFAAVTLMLLVLSAQAQDYPALHAVTGVGAEDVLNIRARPDATSDVVGTLPSDATGVEVVGTEGGWAVVNTGESSGYAALRFLTREPGPDWNSLQVPLTCLGTEPFWSLEIDPAAGETRRNTPDSQGPRAARLTVAWLGSERAPDMAVAVEDGIAVLSPGNCQDGMSERRYGISVQVFRTGIGYVDRDRGCCFLGLP
jgi:uncharacterized membrane protein